MAQITSNNQADSGGMAADQTLTIQMDFPVGKSWLEAMPNEVLTMILKLLAPEDPLKQHGHTFRAVYKKGISELLGLSLASKRLEAVVRIEIYDNVVICRSTDLILLLRTLTENRRTGEYIKNLAFYTTFLRQDPDHEFLNLDILRGLDPNLDLILPEGSAKMTSRQENELRSNLYLKVLEKAPNVQRVAMNTASWAVRGLDDGQLAAFSIASAMAHNRGVPPQIPLPQLPKSVTALTLEGRYQGLVDGLSRQMSGFWAQDVSEESKLKEMTWLYDHTTWFDSLPGGQWASNGLMGQLASLTALYLMATSCRFSDIAIVCDSFPSLKHLVIFSNFPNHCLGYSKTDDMDGPSPSPTRLCLTRNISKLQHLESLHLELANIPDNNDLLGNDGGLDLSSLSRLKQLFVSFSLFVPNKIVTRTSSKYKPSVFLPQSLERLGIMARGYKCEAGVNLMKFLKGLHEDCKYGFPRLRMVLYEYATGEPGFQTVNPDSICLCACFPHEDYCSYDPTSGLQCAFRPWVPAREFQALVQRFSQRDIRLMEMELAGCVVTGGTITIP